MRGRPAARGFSLIELLVVVVIVAVLAGAVLLGLGGSDRRQALIGEAERLAALVRVARDEALLQAVEMGLQVRADRYSFLVWDESGSAWQPLAGNRTLRERRLPDGLRLRLEVDDLPALPGATGNRGPQVLILSSGEMTPFLATLETSAGHDGPSWLVVADGVQPPVAMSPEADKGGRRTLVNGLDGGR